MSLFLRKSFRAGPVRFNLSKSGVGISGGVTGARLSVGPSGTHLHAGRHGLYYRKSLNRSRRRQGSARSGGSNRVQATSRQRPVRSGRASRYQPPPAGTLRAGSSAPVTTPPRITPTPSIAGKLTLAAVAAGLILFSLFNGFFILGGIVGAIAAVIALHLRQADRKQQLLYEQNSRLHEYESALRSLLLEERVSAAKREKIESIRQLGESLHYVGLDPSILPRIKANAHQALLDHTIANRYISDNEAKELRAAEELLELNQGATEELKIEIFRTAWLEAIADHQLSEEEIRTLESYARGLDLHDSLIADELALIEESRQIQALQLPLPPIEPAPDDQPLQRNEVVYLVEPAKVLSRRQSRHSIDGYEYSVRRDGKLIVTDRRIFLVDSGTTAIRYNEIGDVDVNLDHSHIEIYKKGSGRPIIFRVERPLYVGRVIDLLSEAAQS